MQFLSIIVNDVDFLSVVRLQEKKLESSSPVNGCTHSDSY